MLSGHPLDMIGETRVLFAGLGPKYRQCQRVVANEYQTRLNAKRRAVVRRRSTTTKVEPSALARTKC